MTDKGWECWWLGRCEDCDPIPGREGRAFECFFSFFLVVAGSCGDGGEYTGLAGSSLRECSFVLWLINSIMVVPTKP